MSKLLGIDYGGRNVGLAVSNEDQTMAFPKDVLTNDKSLLEKIKTLCLKEEIGAIIIGESHDFKGEENKVMGEIKMFKQLLASQTGLPVYFEPEFMTSAEASRLQGGRSPMLDASAAALILKSFLAKRKNIRP